MFAIAQGTVLDVEPLDFATELVHVFLYGFGFNFAFHVDLGGWHECAFFVKKNRGAMVAVFSGDKNVGKRIAQEFAGPFFGATRVHAFGDGFAQKIGFATDAASGKIAIAADDG